MTTLIDSTSELIEETPPASHCVFVDLGDAMHANDHRNVTPASQHVLDVDGRFAKSLRAAAECRVSAIEMMLERHGSIEVVGVPGNHDLTAFHAIMLALDFRYEKEPRVNVIWNPSDWYAYQWGRCMVVLNHGHKAKAERAVSFASDHWAEMWGQTFWRYMDTGHIHHDWEKDYNGMKWRSHRAPIPGDSFAIGSGYASRQSIKSITMHRERGERGIQNVDIFPKSKSKSRAA